MKLVLHSNCLLVKGYSRSIICDLGRNNIKLIPNSLYEILNNHKGQTIEEIKTFYNHQHDEVIDEYMDFLSENEFIFFSNHPNSFPELNTKWSYNTKITNSIIDFSPVIATRVFQILNELGSLNCEFVQFRFYEKVSIITLRKILKFVKDYKLPIKSVEFILKNNPIYEQNDLPTLIKNFSRLMRVIVYNSDQDKIIRSEVNDNAFLVYTSENYFSEKCCGVIHQKYFTVNISSVTEAMNHNSCLNRKISIDRMGNIKNCPSMFQNYGNIKNTTLKESLSHKDFNKYWNITKDQINICKDCEFRYVCTDCRAYRENPKDIHSKPLKCGYNPYTNKWEEWTTNPLKKEAISYYNMKEIIQNND
ncbi:grasp-with-spasm system SPASM domain peptide maturase [Gaetbulibacter jejuensis]|uniref:Grasp-with-spasm system SPASM domain peptide maturase n=1 Tax=Gaetbulibacter jejuensis TaxID=584607 RepID=A0ABP3UV90_9FLAO